MKEKILKNVFRSSSFVFALSAALFIVACDRSNEPAISEAADTKGNNQAIEPIQAEIMAKAQTKSFPTQVYFGDTHLHTSNSGDAFAFGARLSPEHAYRFAKGEEVTSTTGQMAKLSRPLDFLVVADHAEGLGTMHALLDGHPELVSDPQMARWAGMVNAGGKEGLMAAKEMIRGLANKTLPAIISDPIKSAPFARSIWHKYIETAERHNTPGEFTALIGYEYSSQPKGNNLHRVVVFRDDAKRVGSILPFSSTLSEDPEDLWASLEKYESATGGRVLAIPHNSNLSNGNMFALEDFQGKSIDADYGIKRSRWEPLVEATQIKGDSESHSFLSPNDEYAGYGDSGWEQGNLTLQSAKTNDMLAGDYVREGLKRGLLLQQQTGINPYKFGMIGSTDSHTSLSTGDEDNFFGKNVQMEPKPERTSKIYKKAEAGAIYGWQYLAGGYAAVWAKENTREALFDAMLRKEVYATTGPRIRLRVFAGYGFNQEMSQLPDIAERGYALGVPMGGDLAAETDGIPGFLVRALKDPQGVNLATLQMVKGWINADGVVAEQVFDITQSESQDGAAELSVFWQDPDFDPVLNSFYYVRVLETPSYRWPVQDAQTYSVDIAPEAKLAVQERAYSSPIWVTPE
ncbi:MAG: hypothetical protein ACI9FR_001430 [Cryomorphaceae bacterium]|jgi:hypothetical protein